MNGVVDQGPYVKRVADQLVQTLPPGWEYAQVQFREVGDHAEVDALVHSLAGGMRQWQPPQAVAERFHELREVVRSTPNAWYSAKFEIKSTGEHKVQLNRSDEPGWITPPPSDAYEAERDLAGAPEVLPDWLRAYLPS